MTNKPEPTQVGAASSAARLVHPWVRHRWLDQLVIVPIVIWLILGARGVTPLALTHVPTDVRRALFQVAATLAGTMAGLTLTSVSILINLLRTPLGVIDRLLPAEDKRRVGSVFLSALPNLLLVVAAALSAIAAEANTAIGYWWLQSIVIWFVLASLSALARVVWVLRRLLDLSA
jgi:hypothetical protein